MNPRENKEERREKNEEKENSTKDKDEFGDDEYASAREENETPMVSKRGPGRPRKEKTGKRGRPKKIFQEVPLDQNTEAENQVEEEERRNHEEEHFANLVEHPDPQTAAEALSSPEVNEWREAMIKEYEALEKNGTWIIVDRPEGKRIIESKWVLRTKYNSSG